MKPPWRGRFSSGCDSSSEEVRLVSSSSQSTPSLGQPVGFVQSGPRDGGTLKFHSDAIAVVRHPLTINHLPARHIPVQRSNPYHLVRLPGLFRKEASAVRTNIIGVGLLFSVGSRILRWCQAYCDDDGEPPFHSAIEPVVQGCAASILSDST